VKEEEKEEEEDEEEEDEEEEEEKEEVIKLLQFYMINNCSAGVSKSPFNNQ